MNVQEALDHFLTTHRSPQTRQTYFKFLSKFVNDIGPKRHLEVVSREDIDTYISDMCQRRTKYADHPTRPIEYEPLSAATIYKNVKMIKTFFKWCVRRSYLAESPADHVANSKPGRPLGLGKAIADREVEALLAAARFKPRNYAIVRLLTSSGCRAGELAELRLRNLDLDRRHAYVNGKGNEWRYIYFDDATVEALNAWLEERPKISTDHVFVSTGKNPRPLTAAAVSQVIRRLCHTAHLGRGWGAHSFRHRVGSKFSKARIAPRVTQAYLGHKNITVTLVYYQDVDESDLHEAGKLLSI